MACTVPQREYFGLILIPSCLGNESSLVNRSLPVCHCFHLKYADGWHSKNVFRASTFFCQDWFICFLSSGLLLEIYSKIIFFSSTFSNQCFSFVCCLFFKWLWTYEVDFVWAVKLLWERLAKTSEYSNLLHLPKGTLTTLYDVIYFNSTPLLLSVRSRKEKKLKHSCCALVSSLDVFFPFFLRWHLHNGIFMISELFSKTHDQLVAHKTREGSIDETPTWSFFFT